MVGWLGLAIAAVLLGCTAWQACVILPRMSKMLERVEAIESQRQEREKQAGLVWQAVDRDIGAIIRKLERAKQLTGED